MVQNAGRPHRNVNKIEPSRKLTPGEGKQLYPFVYLGIVKKVNDEDRMGRIWVYIREIDGMQDDPQHWHIMSYCSPFAGGTPTAELQENNTFSGAQTSYGMWFPCPDLGNEIVCMFINGDPNRGIWMGGLFKQQMNHMVPAIPATNTPDGYRPAAEYNKNKNITTNTVGPIRPVYEPLAQGLKFQGLDKDPIRGFASGGGQRQTVSRTYGILTPRGTQIVFDDGFKINQNVDSDETQKNYNPTRAQKGDKNPSKEWKQAGQVDIESRRDELIRFRTRSGAQVMISESEGLTYIINRDGTAWIELTQSGKIDMFANDSVSLHTYGSMNLTAQEDVNIEAGRNINMKARGATTSHPEAGTGNIYIQSAANSHITTGADLRLLVGRNNEILIANDLNVRSDRFDQIVNKDYQLCICENQDIKVGGERKDQVVGDVHTTFESSWNESIGVDQNTNIGLNNSISVGQKRCATIGKNDEYAITGELLVNATAGIKQTSANNIDLNSAMSIRNTAATSIDLNAPVVNIGGSVSMSGGGGATAHFDGKIVVEGSVDVTGGVRVNGNVNANDFSDEYNGHPSIPVTSPSDAEEATPGACIPLGPTEPADPVNPAIAVQPIVNALKVNKDYTASISHRVPEHEPWEGHAIRKVASHAPASGNPNDGLAELQKIAASAPVGSTAFAAQAPGGAIKGNTKPELSTVNFEQIKSTIAEAIANPSTIISTAEAGSMMTIDASAATEIASQTTIESVIDDIVANATAAATYISDGITTIIAEIEAVVSPVVDEVVTSVQDITNTASQAMASISGDVVAGAQQAGSAALSGLQAFADDIIANGAPSLTEIAAIKEATVAATVANTADITKALSNSVSTLDISDNGLLFIANWEQYVPYEYPVGADANGNITTAIGYGFQQLTSDETTWSAYKLAGLTEEESWEFLKAVYIPIIVSGVIRKIKAPLAQNQLDAFVDLAYNRGINNPAVTKSIAAFNKGDMNEVANQFMSNAATVGGDLLARRTQNVKMLLNGEYGELRDRLELKKAGLLDYTLIQWKGEHLWKQFSGFKHKEFINTDQTKSVINEAWQSWSRSTGKAEFGLPNTLPDNSLAQRIGISKLAAIQKQFNSKESIYTLYAPIYVWKPDFIKV